MLSRMKLPKLENLNYELPLMGLPDSLIVREAFDECLQQAGNWMSLCTVRVCINEDYSWDKTIMEMALEALPNVKNLTIHDKHGYPPVVPRAFKMMTLLETLTVENSIHYDLSFMSRLMEEIEHTENDKIRLSCARLNNCSNFHNNADKISCIEMARTDGDFNMWRLKLPESSILSYSVDQIKG